MRGQAGAVPGTRAAVRSLGDNQRQAVRARGLERGRTSPEGGLRAPQLSRLTPCVCGGRGASQKPGSGPEDSRHGGRGQGHPRSR